MTSIFQSVQLAPRDPILGLNEQFNADSRPDKVNLGVGVYTDDNGRLPLLKAVSQAEMALAQEGSARGYLPIEGIPGYNQGVQQLLFGKEAAVITSGRALTAQTLGGTGALRIGADFLKEVLPNARVAISDPSWQNHRALFQQAGFSVDTYAYYDAGTNGLDFNGMIQSLSALEPGTIVVLHACCHNPTGVDPTADQWQEIAGIIKSRQLVPFIDIAYQGFGQGLDVDAAVIRLFAEHDITMLISSSFSKSFSLYGERVGALTLVVSSQEENTRVLSQLKRLIRTNYSNPPTHGASVVANILNTPELFALWETELTGMRERIQDMREQLAKKLQGLTQSHHFDFVLQQSGMFSYTGLSAEQVDKLREEHGIYAVATGRICVAALNSNNVDTVAQAIATVRS